MTSSPIPVEIVPDPIAITIAIVSALIALAAAIASAVAAFHASQATRTARDAYLADAAERRVRQAQHAHAQIETTVRSDFGRMISVTVRLQNTSDGVIFDVELSILTASGEYPFPRPVPVVAVNDSRSETVQITPEVVDDPFPIAVVRFTDYAGVRWERRGSEPPREIGPAFPSV